MACRLFDAKPLPEPMLDQCQLDRWEQVSLKFESEFYPFIQENAFEKVICQNGGHFIGRIFFIRGPMGLSKPEVMVTYPFAPHKLALGAKPCQIWYYWVPDFSEHIHLKSLDGYIPFEISTEWSWPNIVQRHSHLPTCPIWAWLWDKKWAICHKYTRSSFIVLLKNGLASQQTNLYPGTPWTEFIGLVI